MIRIGSSQVGTILGLDPWGSQFKVWAQLHGLVPSSGGSAATARGHMLEEAVGARWLAESGWVGCRGPAYGQPPVLNPEVPVLGVHPDVLVWHQPPSAPVRPDAIAEVKTSKWLPATIEARGRSFPGWGEPGTDQVPRWYAAQGVALMVACQVETVWFPVFGTVDDDFRVYRLDRDERLVRGMLAKLTAWYDRHIVRGEYPEPDGSDTTKWVLDRAIRQQGGERPATPEEVASIDLLRRKKATLRDLEAEVERIAQKVKVSMGGAPALAGPDGRPLVRWSAPKSTTRLDLKRLRKERPDLAKEYAEGGPPVRRFTLKGEEQGDE